MLDGIAQFGVLLLLLLTGMVTDVGLIRKAGRPAIAISLTGISIPFACGVSLGFFLPDTLVPHVEQRWATALFLGVALSISTIKIVAMVVHEMNFMRRDLGQIIVASAIIDNSIGWIIVAVVFGIARGGSIHIGQVVQSVVGVAAFLVLSLTFGRPAVSFAIRFVNDNFVSELPVITLILIIMGAMALITDALGVQSVLQSVTSATAVATTVRANNITLFASLELSKSKWVVTINSPGCWCGSSAYQVRPPSTRIGSFSGRAPFQKSQALNRAATVFSERISACSRARWTSCARCRAQSRESSGFASRRRSKSFFATAHVTASLSARASQ